MYLKPIHKIPESPKDGTKFQQTFCLDCKDLSSTVVGKNIARNCYTKSQAQA